MATKRVRADGPIEAPEPGPLDVSQRHVLFRAAIVGLLMRNSVNAGAALLVLADASSARQPVGTALFIGVAAWSLLRLATRSCRPVFLAVDYLLVLLVCLMIPSLGVGPDFHLSNSAPQAIAGTAVISVSVAVRPTASLPMTLGIAAAYAVGAASVMGWQHVASVTALYYFTLQWLTATVIRIMLMRVAGAIDQARNDRQEAELAERVSDAVRDFDREQLALLHDTAASTLLMAGQEGSLPRDRLAGQARRDLDLLAQAPWAELPPRVDLVAALRDSARHVSTPVEFTGLDRHWLTGETAEPVIAAAREVMTNVERHAYATRLQVAVGKTGVKLSDDGIGFDTDTTRAGHGVDESIIGRMHRCGGQADIESTPGAGTTVHLTWATSQPSAPDDMVHPDPDRLVDRMRTRFGVALLVYSLANLAISVPNAAVAVQHPGAEVAMGILAAVSSLAAIPGIRNGDWRLARPAALALLIIAIVQPAMLSTDALPGYVFWTQNAIGWCLIPLLLALPARTGAITLIGYWAIGSIVALMRDPVAEVWMNIGLGTASILAVQLFALYFTGLIRDAAVVIQTEIQERQRVLTRERVSHALRSEYQRRYAAIIDNVIPLLKELGGECVLDTELQRRARTESRRLRALFDQASTFDHPLMQRIRPLVDAAEARRVDVTVDLTAALPDLTDKHIDALAAPLADILSHAKTHARLVITCSPDAIEVSLVCDAAAQQSTVRHLLHDADVVVDGDQLWCLIRRPLDTESGQPAEVEDSIGR